MLIIIFLVVSILRTDTEQVCVGICETHDYGEDNRTGWRMIIGDFPIPEDNDIVILNEKEYKCKQ